MAMRILSAGSGGWAACLAAGLAAVPTAASAGERHRPQVYLAPATPVVPYAAPVIPYAAPAPMYSAPAYAAPYMMSSAYSAPAVYSAPAAVVGNAPAANGSASRIKAVDRADLIEDARHEMKDLGEGKLSERRKSLREKVRGLYAAAIDDEESALNPAEEQDVEAIVASLLDPNGVGMAPTAGYAPTVYQQAPAVYQQAPAVYQQAPTVYQQAPAVYQQAPTMYLQPMTPVQFLVPVQAKHGIFHR